MSLVVVDATEEDFLDLVLAVNYTLHLFTNDVTNGLTQSQIDLLDETDFTEATFAGYGSKALTGGSWTTTQASPSEGVYAEQSFIRSSTGTAQNVWGYYLTRTSDGALRWFEQFTAPIVVEFISDQIDVTPTITLDDVKGNAVQSGTITMFGSATAPSGWLACDGSAVSRTAFADLFAVVGEQYGVGDGSTTFNLPDLRQRFPLGKAAAGTGGTMGDTGGAIDHVHDLSTGAAAIRLSASALATKVKASGAWTDTRAASGLTTAATSAAQTNGADLVGDTDTENPPFQVVQFIIKT